MDVSQLDSLCDIYFKESQKKNKYLTLCSDICYGNQQHNYCLYLQEMDSMLCKIAKRALRKHVYTIASGRLTDISF
jgi:hypothetical protein